MNSLYPMWMEWDGEAMRPLNARAADRQYVIGERYHLEHREDRSAASHAHYFAALAEAHINLPDEMTERLPTPDHLRRFALIRTGYRDERSIVCSSKAEAQRLSAFVKPMDEFAIVTVTEATVTVWTAKSQSYRAMGKAEFQKSKDAVLGYLADLIGVTPEALTRAA